LPDAICSTQSQSSCDSLVYIPVHVRWKWLFSTCVFRVKAKCSFLHYQLVQVPFWHI
jgi:hypothetical protein